MSARSTFAAWAELWRSAPASDKIDLLRIVMATPCMAYAFFLLWGMLP